MADTHMGLQNGTYYGLGQKTFWFLVFQKSSKAVGLLCIAVLLSVMHASVASVTGVQLNTVLSYIANGLFVCAILLLANAVAMARLECNVSKVMLDDSSLRIVQGIFNRRETILPYRRIQSVEIKQSFLYRQFGVGHLVIATTTDLEQPGQKENEADDEVVPIMDYDLAHMIADALTVRAEVEHMQVQQNNPPQQSQTQTGL